MAYKLTNKASEDIIALYVGGVEQFGQAVAERYQDGLKQVFGFLSDYPRAARERTEIDPPVRAHPYKSHLVVYVLDGDDILILGIRHGREDWANQTDIADPDIL